MTAQTFILPYDRPSPVHIPRRDLVLSAADSLSLNVTVVENDHPDAAPITVTGGLGGPALRMYVWADSTQSRGWDYGAPCPSRGTILWTGLATLGATSGTFVLQFPAGTMASWPLRSGFSLQLEWDSARQVEMLAQGYLHARRTGITLVPLTALSTDAGELIQQDATTEILGA